MPIWKDWKTYCNTCKGYFTHTCWEDQIPVKCACGGILIKRRDGYYFQDRAEGHSSGFYKLPEPKQITTKDPAVILRDLEECENERLEESAEHI